MNFFLTVYCHIQSGRNSRRKRNLVKQVDIERELRSEIERKTV